MFIMPARTIVSILSLMAGAAIFGPAVIATVHGADTDGKIETPVAQPSTAKETAKTGEAQPPLFPTAESMKELYQPYLPNLESYEPMYFLVGTNPEDSKFQVSLKYRLFSEEGSLAQRFPWITGFHFGYTQTSFWDLKSASAPFEDTSYKPEVLFLFTNITSGIPCAKGFFVQSGLQHESNGRDGNASRSTNFLYLRPMCVFYDEASRLGLMVAPRLWLYLANAEDTNPDLSEYRGYFDLEVKVGKADGVVLGSHLRWAEEGGSTQLDLTYPLHRWLSGNLDVYLQVQYVDGLAESLLHFRERTRALRLGVALVR